MHEIDRFIDSALTLLPRHAAILRVSLINYSFIGKQEKGIMGKETNPDGVDSTIIKGNDSRPIVPG